jgi:5-deoxy-glucuronate isomerase
MWPERHHQGLMAKAFDPKKLIFTGTASHRGRSISVSPQNSSMEHLHYGRILLDGDVSQVGFGTDGRETALLCMRGECVITVDDKAYPIGTYDAIYVPRGSTVQVTTATDVDLVECAADVVKEPSQKFRAGGAATSRDLNIIIGDNVRAGRILAGFTRSVPGNWTSWPPHEHTELLEEMYVYFDMPAPAFGVQLVYTSPDQPEFVGLVRDGDAVLMPGGYHPNVAAPGHSINFIWMMAAHREQQDRLFGVVNVQPGFDQSGSGLEASQPARPGDG